MNHDPAFGQRLKELRQHKVFSQSRLARESLISRNYLRQIEAGKSMPSFSVACRLAAVLGVSLQKFQEVMQ